MKACLAYIACDKEVTSWSFSSVMQPRIQVVGIGMAGALVFWRSCDLEKIFVHMVWVGQSAKIQSEKHMLSKKPALSVSLETADLSSKMF